MKRYNSKFVYIPSFIDECIHLCLKTRWKRKDTSYFFAEYIIKLGLNENAEDIHKIAKTVRHIAKTNREELYYVITLISHDMYNDIKNRTISFKPIEYQIRKDTSSGKDRNIGISSIKQQVFDYIAIESCKNMFLAKIGYYQCASLKDKGQLFGKTAIEKWIRKNPKKLKYVYKCDINKCYPSIDHEVLKMLLRRDLKNDDCLYLIYSLIDTYGDKGLCIGSYLSQYLANYYLSYAYHYISENAYKIRKHKDGTYSRVRLITHVLFYMDDFIIFASRKADLNKAVKMLNSYCNDFLHLTIKDNAQLFSIDDRFVDMMGYKIYKDHTTIRRRNFLKIRKLFIKYKDQSKEMSLNDARSILSYYGWVKHSDSKMFCKKYKVNRTIERAKGVVSEYDKSRIHGRTTTIQIYEDR